MSVDETAITLPTGVSLYASICGPTDDSPAVIFAHGSGSSRHSPRNRFVARRLNERGLLTLLLDLLTPSEDRVDRVTGEHRFDISLLGRRVTAVVDWVRSEFDSPLGLFGASTGAAAALVAAANRPEEVGAVVSRGGRPDLAGATLELVASPTLLIVGGRDVEVLALNREAQGQMTSAETRLDVVEGATHLFEEPGALETVAELAATWFLSHLGP